MTTSLSYPNAYRRTAEPSALEDFQSPDRAPTDPGFGDYLRQGAQNTSAEVAPLREDQQCQRSAVDLRSEMLPIHMQGFRQVSERAKIPGVGQAFSVSAKGFMDLEPRNTCAGDQILGAKHSVRYPEKRRHDSPVPW